MPLPPAPLPLSAPTLSCCLGTSCVQESHNSGSILSPIAAALPLSIDVGLRCETFGLRPYQASYGVLPSTATVGDLFLRYTTVLITSINNSFGMLVSCKIALVLSSTVLLFLSLTPF